MEQDPIQSHLNLQPDLFRLGRVAALQPHLDERNLSQPPMQTTDPMIVNNVANVVRMWGHDRQDVPNDFCELVTIQSVSRQPLAFVVVEAEQVARTITSSDVPFSGGTFDSHKWPTNDVFELAPLAPLSFPREETSHESLLAGQEDLRQCEPCSGAGRCACMACGATGQVQCPTCGGTQQVICPTCEGAGTHIGVRGSLIQCQTCRTRGYIRCTRCAQGNLPCSNCESTGQTLCSTCLGFGNLLRRWSLVSRTSSWREFQSHVSVDWRLPLDCLLDDCQEVASTTWPGITATELKGIPKHLASLAEKLIDSHVKRAGELDKSFQRVAGMRVSIFGAYVYKVDWDYEGQVESIFLGGLHSRAFTPRGVDRKNALRGFVRSWSRRLSRPFDKPLIDRAYLKAVRAGEVHVSDTRTIVPAAARQIGARVGISVDGYTLVVPARAYGEAEPQPTNAEVSWDVDDSGQLLLCTTLFIGPATRRDTFPKLLSLNHELSFGRLALQHSATPRLALVDRRIYETIKTSDYGRILVSMASEARELQGHDAFR